MVDVDLASRVFKEVRVRDHAETSSTAAVLLLSVWHSMVIITKKICV